MRWLDDVEEDLRMMRISGWKGKARRRDEWKSVLREVKERSTIGYRYCTYFIVANSSSYTRQPIIGGYLPLSVLQTTQK
jgi:hypothetical protein